MDVRPAEQTAPNASSADPGPLIGSGVVDDEHDAGNVEGDGADQEGKSGP